jgi:hypothetical protein
MGLVNEEVTTYVGWLDYHAQPVSDAEKRARETTFKAEKDLLAKKDNLGSSKEEFAELLKQLKREQTLIAQERRKAKEDTDIEQCDSNIILADVEIQDLLKEAADAVAGANAFLQISKIELVKLKVARGCP